MAQPDQARRLVVNADDFGRSSSINQAVVAAHRDGILTSASLMVNEPFAAEAVAFAKTLPALGVGLHVALVCGSSALSRNRIPGLLQADGKFSNAPTRAGLAFFFRPDVRAQIRAEVAAQFERFDKTGLKCDHVNGHLHIHMHPAVLPAVLSECRKRLIRSIRWTREPLWTDLALNRGNNFYRVSHAAIYAALSRWSYRRFRNEGVRHTSRVFGLLQNGRVTADYLMKLLPVLPPGDSELYSHPSLDEFKPEYDALVDSSVKRMVRDLNIKLLRYQDL